MRQQNQWCKGLVCYSNNGSNLLSFRDITTRETTDVSATTNDSTQSYLVLTTEQRQQ